MNLITKLLTKIKRLKPTYVQTEGETKPNNNTMAKKNTNNETEVSAAENVKALLSASEKTNAEKIASVKEFLNSLDVKTVRTDDYLNNLCNAAFNPSEMDVDKIRTLNALVA